MRCFDGRRTPDEIARALAEQGMRILGAHGRGVRTQALVDRRAWSGRSSSARRSSSSGLRAERRRRRQPTLFRGELLRMRWSIGDPDALFDRVLPTIRWCFTPAFLVGLGAAVRRVLRRSRVDGGTSSRARSRNCTRSPTSRSARSSCSGAPRCRHPHPRAGPRVHVQVLRRRSARDGIHAHLLPARVLLQRERRVELSRGPLAGSGSRPPEVGFSSSSPAWPRSSGRSPDPARSRRKSRSRRCSSAGRRRFSRT